jgi:hypothetical protein
MPSHGTMFTSIIVLATGLTLAGAAAAAAQTVDPKGYIDRR